jgi:hypothetical protein
MSGFEESAPPPELPEEYSDVYRDAYRRAYGDLGEAGPGSESDGVAGPLLPALAPVRSARFGPLLVGGLVVLALCSVLGIKLLVADGEGDSSTLADPEATVIASPSSVASSSPSSDAPTAPAPTPTLGSVWDGVVRPVAISGISASCTGAPSVDAAGDPVRYGAGNAADQDPSTAWRCDSRALGETLTLVLPVGSEVAEVGLIGGYAKTDPTSGADRFTENNRITQVRWTFDDGSSVVQELDPSQRTVQFLRIPVTGTTTVVLEVLAVESGSRDRTAISELSVAAAG